MLVATTQTLGFFQGIIDELKKQAPNILFAIVILIAGILISKLVVKLMAKGLEKSKIDLTFHDFAKSLVKILLYTLVFIIALSILGVPTTSIITVIGTAGLAIGLALQNSLSNLAGGFIILFFKPFKVGDYVETNGASGTVTQINILYTCLVTPDNTAIYIPNGQVSNNKAVNATMNPLRRLDMTFPISYSDDFKVAIKAIEGVISEHPLALQDPEPFVRVCEYGCSSINIVARVWVNTADYWTLHFDMLEQVKLAFDKNNISIPSNPLNLTIRS